MGKNETENISHSPTIYTKKNIKLKIPEKPCKIKGFQSRSYRKATTISSQPRYDHFDTSPHCIFNFQGFAGFPRPRRKMPLETTKPSMCYYTIFAPEFQVGT